VFILRINFVLIFLAFVFLRFTLTSQVLGFGLGSLTVCSSCLSDNWTETVTNDVTLMALRHTIVAYTPGARRLL